MTIDHFISHAVTGGICWLIGYWLRDMRDGRKTEPDPRIIRISTDPLKGGVNDPPTQDRPQEPKGFAASLMRTMERNPNGCGCHKCNPRAAWFVVCDTCGCKRCPHATDHDLTCTGSNEPGQKGSLWENCK